jgi:hypothetical protein
MRRMRALDGVEFDELLDGRFRRRVGALDQYPAPQDVVEIERVHGPMFEAVVGARRASHYCPGRCGASVEDGGKTFMCRSCWPRLPLDLRVAIDGARPNPSLLTDLTKALRDARIWFQLNPIPEANRRG